MTNNNTLSDEQKSVISVGMENGEVVMFCGQEGLIELVIPVNFKDILPDFYDGEGFSLGKVEEDGDFIYYHMPIHTKNWRDCFKES